MDSKSNIQALSDDPEQWYQPGPEQKHPAEELADGFQMIGDALSQLFSGINDAIQATAEKLKEAGRQYGKSQISEAIAEELAKKHSIPELEALNLQVPPSLNLEPLAPVVEAIHGHWMVCKHRPRCKKPPAHSAFNREAGKKRRSKAPN